MKTRIGILVVLCTVLSCTSSTSVANAEKQNREVGAFRNIKSGSGIDVYFTQEQSQSVRIETENVDENEVITEVKDETLVIKMKSNNSWFNNVKRSVKVYISAPVLERLDISSGSDFYADNLKSTNFNISSTSGSDVKIGNLTVDNEIKITSSSGSDSNIKNLKANDCTLSASSGSDMTLGVEISGKISVSASSASDIKLSGKVHSVSITASSGSDVNVRNLQYEQIDSKSSSGGSVHK